LEKEDKLKALRKKDQAARLERVSYIQRGIPGCINVFCRKRKRPELPRRGKRRSGKRIMPMMNFFRSRIERRQITRIVVRIGRMTLCNSSTEYHLDIPPLNWCMSSDIISSSSCP